MYVGGRTTELQMPDADPIRKTELYKLRNGATPPYCNQWRPYSRDSVNSQWTSLPNPQVSQHSWAPGRYDVRGMRPCCPPHPPTEPRR